jgi:hypothetical protein
MLPFSAPALVVKDRRIGRHRGDRIEDRGQHFVGDIEHSTGVFRRGLAFSDDGGDPLAGETHDIVENIGIVRIDQVVLVEGGAVEPARHVLPGEDLDHSRRRHRPLAANGEDAGMGVRRAQHLEVRQPLHGHVHGVACAARDDACGKRVRQARAAGPAGDVILDFSHAGKSVADRAVAGAPAQVALERMRQVRPLLLRERG